MRIWVSSRRSDLTWNRARIREWLFMPANTRQKKHLTGRKTPRRTETGRLLPGVINCQASDTSANALPRSHVTIRPVLYYGCTPCNYRGAHATLNNERLRIITYPDERCWQIKEERILECWRSFVFQYPPSLTNGDERKCGLSLFSSATMTSLCMKLCDSRSRPLGNLGARC